MRAKGLPQQVHKKPIADPWGESATDEKTVNSVPSNTEYITSSVF